MGETSTISSPIYQDFLHTQANQYRTITAAGDFLVVLDSPTRENEGDLITSASAPLLTPQKVSFMIHYTSGYLCCPLPASVAKSLELRPMVEMDRNEDEKKTAYTVTVDAAGRGITTGISARDRCTTCHVLAEGGRSATRFKKGAATEANQVGPQDLRRPGHVVPLIARDGGVRERQGHTEAAVEFCRLAGLDSHVAVIGELVEGHQSSTDGDAVEQWQGSTGMMRGRECVEFGRRWGIKVCTVEHLVRYVSQK